LSDIYQDLSVLKTYKIDAKSNQRRAMNGAFSNQDDEFIYLDDGLKSADEEVDYLLGSHADLSLDNPKSSHQNPETNTVLATIDSKSRYACKFVVERPADIKKSLPVGEDTLRMVDSLIIPKAQSASSSIDMKNIQEYELFMKSFEPYPDDESIHMSDGSKVISKHDDDVVSRMLKSDQLAYERVFTAIKDIIYSMSKSSSFRSSGGVNPALRKSYVAVEALYSRQQVWKRVAKGFFGGVRDHGEDFNQQELDQVPESWKIRVDGRPVPQPEDGAEDELAEDAVCMCCFDGTSTDGNRIVFCDGCNASMHQACYGLAEIPEGDYYCERCKEVQYTARSIGKAFNRYDAVRLVSCCLCPVKHGGIKPTTDGRWVHLCCAIWSKNAVILDMAEMSPIDVKGVEFQRQLRGSGNTIYDQACKICNSFGGFVVKCSGCDLDKPCTEVFHPLCAWFEGCYIVTSITDPSFQGNDRKQLYPSGLDSKFYCHKHSNTSPSSSRMTQAAYQSILDSRRGQMNLRRKYMMKDEDLACVPGSDRRKHVKKAKKDAGDGNARSAARPQQVQEKELTIDVYDTKTCALCMTSSDPLIKSDSWSKFLCMEIPAKPVAPEENQELLPILHVNVSATATTEDPDSREIIEEHNRADVDDSSPLIASSSNSDQIAQENYPTNGAQVNINASSTVMETASHPASSFSSSSTAAVPISTANGKIVREENLSSDSISNMMISCKSCHLSLHATCLKEITSVPLSKLQSNWMCSPCQQGLSNVSCIYCPRRGGLFLNTSELQWCHLYCAKHSNCSGKLVLGGNEDPANPSQLQNAILDIRSSGAKKNAKQKCNICNRKVGQPQSCHFPGCVSFFHPLCAERSGRGYVSMRNGVREYFCSDHIPEGVERVSYRSLSKSGLPSLTRHWVNGNEMQRLRYALVRSLTVLDSISRREKHKRLLSKADGEYFGLKMKSQLDKIKGRKNEGISGADISELFDDSSSEESVFLGDEAEYASDHGHDLDILNPDSSTNNRRRKANRGQPQQLEVVDDWIPGLQPTIIRGTELYVASGGEDEQAEMRIGANWNDGTNIVLPNRIFIGIGGYEFDRRETLVEGGYKAFLRIFKERMMNVVQTSRAACGIFTTSQQANEFNRKIGPQLLKHMNMPMEDFKQAIAKDGFVYKEPKEAKASKPSDEDNVKPRFKKAKKHGYVILMDDDDEEMVLKDEKDYALPSRRSRHKVIDDDSVDEEAVAVGRRRRSSLARSSSTILLDEDEDEEDAQPTKRRRNSVNVDDADEDIEQPAITSNRRANSSSNSAAAQAPQEKIDKATVKKKRPSLTLDKDDVSAAPIPQAASNSPKPRGRKSDPGPRAGNQSSVPPQLELKFFNPAPNALTTDYNIRRAAATAAGAYQSRKQLISALDADPLCKSLINCFPLSSSALRNIDERSEPIEDLFSIGGIPPLDPTTAPAVDLENEWLVYSDDLLPSLERQIQDIIHIIESKQIPDEFVLDDNLDPQDESRQKKKRGHAKPSKKQKSNASSSALPMRQLCEDYVEIPEESFPEYSNYVRHILTLESLKAQLQQHMFRSMSVFSKAFYEMLNNSKAVTPIDSKVCHLASLYDLLLRICWFSRPGQMLIS
jgi:hypothetical protein